MIALDQLDDIEAFIGQDSPRSAKRVVDYILGAALSLETSPYLGREVPGTILREFVLAKYPYIIGYTVLDHEVRVLTIHHHAQKHR